MNKNTLNSKTGFYETRHCGVVMFEVEGIEAREEIRNQEFKSIYSRYVNENASVNIGGYHVPVWGVGHNLYPQEVHAIIEENKLLPGILAKQIDFLYGKGPYLYKTEVVDGSSVRVPVLDAEITRWLESWEKYGFADYREYLRNLISDFYHVRTCCTQYHFTKKRLLGEEDCVYALSYVGSDEARLATDKQYVAKRIKQQDCRYVIVGDWTRIGSSDYDVFPRFDPAHPIAQPEAISFASDKTFGKWVYSYNQWFMGLKDWITASNLTPRYLNSYLKNALNAHIHCRIPQAWYASQRTILQQICQDNIIAVNGKLTTEYKGVKLIGEDGKPYAFSEAMMEELIHCELDRITSMLSGEGKNQGKLYATTKIGDEGWDFNEMPGKFKEYFDSVISYDKRADQVTLAGVGINSSITNVENDGVISKSGSDVYYNYMVYLNTLVFPEYFVCREINRALAMNFAHAREQGIKIGFHIEIPSRQNEISPNDRLNAKQPV